MSRHPHHGPAGRQPGNAGTREEVAAVSREIGRHLRYSLAREESEAGSDEIFRAVALSVRDRLVDGMLATRRRQHTAGAKRVGYISMEFLIGRLLGDTLRNLGVFDAYRSAVAALGHDLEDVLAVEADAALGNGGLGRLAACFLDSMATLGIAGTGYGINYEFGLFRQEIDNGQQREQPDHWLAFGSPWQVERPDQACLVPVYGHIEHGTDQRGGYNPMWLGWRVLVGVPHDIPVAGYGGATVNTLRLFSARSSNVFDMQVFNDGDYMRAVEDKIGSETISKVLYPSDSVAAGKELRLLQEYFLVACAMRDVLRTFQASHADIRRLPERQAIQLNDTHPALSVVELMRVLVDEHALPWEEAWRTVVGTMAYTNHTLMSEALERWPVPLLERVLPRHLQILYEINRRFLEEVAVRWPGDGDRQARMSLIEEGEPKLARMANLAIVGSHAVNGVAAVHSELVKTDLVPDFYAMWPERFGNKTNGVTPRRWLLTANPRLAALLTAAIGPGWVTDLDLLRGIEPLASDSGFLAEVAAIKRHNKDRLAALVNGTTRVSVDPAAQLDVQIKRIHQYKRQLLNLLHVAYQYLRLVEDGVPPAVPKTYLLAGKAAPGYWAAKQIIRLANAIAGVVNADPRAAGWLTVAFVPDYRVSLAEIIIPAADLSEQISTAGTEASGTSNMKLALNGALTIGTRDGANIEIGAAVGEENAFLFGLDVAEVRALRAADAYRPHDYCRDDPALARVIEAIGGGAFSPHDRGLFAWIRDALLDPRDPYVHLADFGMYREAQERSARLFTDPAAWTAKAVLNIARVGRFSSDRTIREYAAEIWGAPCPGR